MVRRVGNVKICCVQSFVGGAEVSERGYCCQPEVPVGTRVVVTSPAGQRIVVVAVRWAVWRFSVGRYLLAYLRILLPYSGAGMR